MTNLLPRKTSIPFLSYRKTCFFLSILLVLGSVYFLFFKGLNFGIDFRGGILMEVRTAEPNQISVLRPKLNDLKLGEVSLQEFGQPTDILSLIHI